MSFNQFVKYTTAAVSGCLVTIAAQKIFENQKSEANPQLANPTPQDAIADPVKTVCTLDDIF